MKNPTIWESASKPLFVRTVWLEGSELRRGLQRHFLCDYETKRPLDKLNATINTFQQKKKETLKRSLSIDLDDYYPDFEDLNETGTADFLLGSAKIKLHDPRSTYQGKRAKLTKFSSRTLFFKRKYPSYDSYNCSKDISRRPSDLSELYSRKNSLHDQKNDTLDERLAERVLHWLDLKGKEELLKNISQLKEMEVKLSKTAKLRQDSIRRYYNSKSQNSHKNKPVKSKNTSRANTKSQVQTKTAEPVKHITIIFNKEGQPIRLNRPARNIDLCALSASPSTTRRLAGSLASARLYKSAENNRCIKTSYQTAKTSGGNKSLSASRRLDTVADLTNSNLQKRLLDNPLQATSFNNLHDVRKELHIFMPTLPKKGLARNLYTNCNNNNTEDADISELSHHFSELCRI